MAFTLSITSNNNQHEQQKKKPGKCFTSSNTFHLFQPTGGEFLLVGKAKQKRQSIPDLDLATILRTYHSADMWGHGCFWRLWKLSGSCQSWCNRLLRPQLFTSHLFAGWNWASSHSPVPLLLLLSFNVIGFIQWWNMIYYLSDGLRHDSSSGVFVQTSF